LSYDMRVEPATAIIGIDIEGMLCQAGDRRAHEPAAEGKDQPSGERERLQ
jgi:hypothetical protein